MYDKMNIKLKKGYNKWNKHIQSETKENLS